MDNSEKALDIEAVNVIAQPTTEYNAALENDTSSRELPQQTLPVSSQQSNPQLVYPKMIVSDSSNEMLTQMQQAVVLVLPPEPVKTPEPTSDSATANSGVKHEMWDVEIFDCFTDLIPNTFTAFCLPFVSLSQIAARIGLLKYPIALMVYGITYLLMSFLWIHFNLATDEGRSWRPSYQARPTFGVPQVVNLVASWIVVFLIVHLRSQVRKRFRIPGNILEDVFLSACCPFCTIAQMATHTKSYKPGSCDFRAQDIIPAYD